MAALRLLLVFSLLSAASSSPFFGNNYILPQSGDLARYASAVVTNLNSARNSVSSYTRYPPTSSSSLNKGALVLAEYVGNVSHLVGNVYGEISRAATDRSTAPAVVFSKIKTHFNLLQPLIQNASLYVDAFAAYFDYEGDNSTSSYFADRNERMKENSRALYEILQNVSAVIDSVQGLGFNTQEFLAALQANGLLQKLLDAVQGAAVASGEFSEAIARTVAAINTANSFRATSNSRIQSSRQSTTGVVNSYVTNSNASFNSVLQTTDNLFNHLKTLNNSFVYRWPLLLGERVEQKLHLLNQSIENLILNLSFRRVIVETHYNLTRYVFRDRNEPQSYLEEEAELLTRALTNVVKPNSCTSNFRTQFFGLPASTQSLLSQCFDAQLGLERQGTNQVVSIANNFLRSYASAVYGSLETCFSYPFEKMSDCLDQIVATIDFGGKFFLLDTVTFYLFEQLQSELLNCNSRLLEYVRSVGVRATCGL